MENNQTSTKKDQVLSSTMTFSSKNTLNNSMEAQSILIEGIPIPKIIDSSPKHTETPKKRQQNHEPLTFINRYSSCFSKQKYEMVGPPEDDGSLVSRYREIERILKGENANLKNQNNLLLQEINRLRQSNNKYKKLDKLQKLELQQLKEQSEAQRRRADELKEIVMARMAALQNHVKEGNSFNKSSFLDDMLELSKDFNQ